MKVLDCLDFQESKESLGTGYVGHMADCSGFLMGLFDDPLILLLIPESACTMKTLFLVVTLFGFGLTGFRNSFLIHHHVIAPTIGLKADISIMASNM